jgi:hypothetical protein
MQHGLWQYVVRARSVWGLGSKSDQLHAMDIDDTSAPSLATCIHLPSSCQLCTPHPAACQPCALHPDGLPLAIPTLQAAQLRATWLVPPHRSVNNEATHGVPACHEWCTVMHAHPPVCDGACCILPFILGALQLHPSTQCSRQWGGRGPRGVHLVGGIHGSPHI